MATLEQARDSIYKELTSEDSEVRGEYLKHFEAEAREFAEYMAHAFVKWRDLDKWAQGHERRAYVSAFVSVAITLHILSMKLFLSGQTVAAGNLMRQVIECMALALLCSGKELGVLNRFMADQYSSTDAVRDVVRHRKKLSIKSDAIAALKESRKFYHQFSHVTKMTIAFGMSFSELGQLYVGASFDDGKLEAYTKEAKERVSLASVFANFVDAVTANTAKW